MGRQPLELESRNAAQEPLEPDAHATWVELNNQATDDLAAGEFALAVERLERCNAGEPSNPVFRGNLVEALVRLARFEHEEDELARALEHLARALELGTAREDGETLRQLNARWERELQLEHDDTSDESSRFSLSYDVDRTEILHRSHLILEHLERSYDELVRWFGRDPLADAPPTRVVLYEPADFDRLTGLGDWAAGVFDGVVRVSLRDLEQGEIWRSVLVHELVHAFVRALAGPNIPGWLNEGLAQLLEPRRSDPGRASLLAEGPLFSLAELGGSLATWSDSRAIARAYAQSVLFVEYLQRTYGDESLRRMVLAPGSGQSIEAAFEAFTSVSLAIALEDWSSALTR